MITPAQFMEFIHEENTEETLFKLGNMEKIEAINLLSMSIDQDLEILITKAIEEWFDQEEKEECLYPYRY